MDDLTATKRRRGRARALAAALGLLALAAPAGAAEIDPALVSIGTGGKTGVYYIAGGAICGLVNDARWETGLRCLAESSAGSIDNLRDVRSGARTFGIVQSDWQHHAVEGSDAFEEAGPDRDLRAVFGLFPEAFTVVARPDAGILGFADLRGKRVSFGPAGSGGRATMNLVLAELGWRETDFGYVSDLAMPAVPRALCNGEIDAAVFIVAHPNLAVEDMATSCGAVLVAVEGPPIARLVAESPTYVPVSIPAETYAGQPESVPTFALTGGLVTSSRTSPAIVYELTRAVFENFDAFRAAHPAFAGLERARMAGEGLSAPLHEGALRYFREVGLR
jgi:TRAP transporter TAXI family solute receptor